MYANHNNSNINKVNDSPISKQKHIFNLRDSKLNSWSIHESIGITFTSIIHDI